MKFAKKLSAIVLSAALLLTGCSSGGNQKESSTEDKYTKMSYEEALKEAEGTTVTFYGWGGSDQTNNYIDKYIAPKLKKEHNITVKRVGMNIDEILNNLQNSVQANEEKGNIDVIWINGENFYTAKENNLLFGPFTEKLPNFEKYVNGDADDTKLDFGYPTDGYEAPFGKAQVVMEYNSDKVKPIKNADELLEAAKANIE